MVSLLITIEPAENPNEKKDSKKDSNISKKNEFSISIPNRIFRSNVGKEMSKSLVKSDHLERKIKDCEPLDMGMSSPPKDSCGALGEP